MKYALPLFSALFLLSACGGGGGSGGNDDRGSNVGTRTVSIAFKAVAGNADIACNTTYTLGSADTEATLKNFLFYVHDLRLVSNTGAEVPVTLEQNDWQNGAVALLDFQNRAAECGGATKAVHTVISGTVPDNGAVLTGVRFTVGVPEDRNHLLNASQPSPLNVTSLYWGWQSGYKFMRLDFAPVGGGTQSNGDPFTAWSFHLGSTGCVGLPQNGNTVTCSNINRPDITLTDFDVSTDSIQLNYATIVAQSNLALDAGGKPGCMSDVTDPECNHVFTTLGLNLASGENDTSLVQSAFSVVP